MTTEPTVTPGTAVATPSPVAGGYAVSSESRNWATLSHLSAFVMFFGVPALLGPLVAWLIKTDDPYVVQHSKEALNFNISFLIYTIVAAFSIILVVGVLLLPAVLVTWFVLVIVAAVKTAGGEDYQYPLTMRLVV